MKKIAILLLAIFVLAGCTMFDKAKRDEKMRSKIRRNLLGVDNSDGIDNEEAIILAQNFIIDYGADSYLSLKKAYARNQGDFWGVIFPPKNPYSFDAQESKSEEILVIKTSGDIPPQSALKLK